MFTGLVKEVGTVASMVDGRLTIDAPETATTVQLGDSVAIDGVCLTVVARVDSTLGFDAVPETLARTALGTLDHGSRVNVEPALRAGDALGGHFVQGHIDGVGTVGSIVPEGEGRRVRFEAPVELLRYIVAKGSVAVQGTSLTVAAVDETGFEVALIPHTLAATTLGMLEPEQPVNLETDVLAKYVEKLLPAQNVASTI